MRRNARSFEFTNGSKVAVLERVITVAKQRRSRALPGSDARSFEVRIGSKVSVSSL